MLFSAAGSRDPRKADGGSRPILSLQLSKAGAGASGFCTSRPTVWPVLWGTRGSPGAAAPCRALGGRTVRPGRGEGLPEEPPAEPASSTGLEPGRAAPPLRCLCHSRHSSPVPLGTLAVTPRSESSDDICHWSQCRPDGSCSTQLKSSISVTTVVLSADMTTCTELLASRQDACFPLTAPAHPRSHRKDARYHGKTWAVSLATPATRHSHCESGTCQGPWLHLISLAHQPLGKLALQA